MHNLVIPIAGMGKRFLDNGYSIPKQLIFAGDKTCIEWSLNSVNLKDFKIHFIIRKDQVSNHFFDKILYKKFGKNIKIHIIEKMTRGSVESCLAAEKDINNNNPLTIFTVDVNFFPILNKEIFNNKNDGNVLTFKSNSSNYSYAAINKENFVIRTAEKEVISNNAHVGVYNFKHGNLFVKYAKKMINDNILSNNEFYIAPLYNLLIKDGLKIGLKEVSKMHLFGTPDELNFFENKTIRSYSKTPIGLCSDHSGYKLKESFKKFLQSKKIKYIDFGTYVENPSDYIDFIRVACDAYNKKFTNCTLGFCRSGQGVNISGGQFKNIIPALIYNYDSLKLAIEHNCANYFSFPSNIWKSKDISKIFEILSKSTFDGGRHQNRLSKVFK